MNVIVDLVIVTILAFCTFWGYKKGFIVTVFNMFGGLLRFLISVLLARPVASFLSNAFIKPICDEYFEKAFRKFLESSSSSSDFQDVFSSATDFFARYGIEKSELEAFGNNSGNSIESFIDKVVDAVSSPVAYSISFLISFFVILTVVSILYKVIVKIFDLISKLPVLNASNKTLGVVCGVLHGILNSVIFASVLFYLEAALKASDSLFFSSFAIEKTFLVRLFSLYLN